MHVKCQITVLMHVRAIFGPFLGNFGTIFQKCRCRCRRNPPKHRKSILICMNADEIPKTPKKYTHLHADEIPMQMKSLRTPLPAPPRMGGYTPATDSAGSTTSPWVYLAKFYHGEKIYQIGYTLPIIGYTFLI